MPHETLTIREAAEQLRISRPTLYALLNRANHPLPSIRVGRRRLIPRAALLDWIATEQEVQPNG